MDGAVAMDGGVSIDAPPVSDGGVRPDGSWSAGCVVGAGLDFVEVASTRANDSRHQCVRASDGRVACWGMNYFGALGVPTDIGGLTIFPPVWVAGITDELAPGVAEVALPVEVVLAERLDADTVNRAHEVHVRDRRGWLLEAP